MLSAHRLSTVMPTEAFWMKGTSLHRVTPNGQSSARSCRNTPTIKQHVPNVRRRLRNFEGRQKSSSVISLSHGFHSLPCCSALLWVMFLLFFLLLPLFLLLLLFSWKHLNPKRCSSPWNSSEHETFSCLLWLSGWNVSTDQPGSYVAPVQCSCSVCERVRVALTCTWILTHAHTQTH